MCTQNARHFVVLTQFEIMMKKKTINIYEEKIEGKEE
jgi:hypothetical protein